MRFKFSASDRARTGLATPLANFFATQSVRYTLGVLGGLLSLGVLCTIVGCADSGASPKQPQGTAVEASIPVEIARPARKDLLATYSGRCAW
jgi:hypothetical protein